MKFHPGIKKSHQKLFCLIFLGILGVSWCTVSIFLTASSKKQIHKQPQRKQFGDLRPGSPEFTKLRDLILDYESAEHQNHTGLSHADSIIPGLYVGSKRAVEGLPADVSLVISCRTDPKRPQIPENISWKPIAVVDKTSADLTPFFDEVFEAVENASTGVLIHCNRGISRSSSFVIAYLMKKFNVSYDAAYRYVHKKHPACNPNHSFERQLEAYEKTLGIERKESGNSN